MGGENLSLKDSLTIHWWDGEELGSPALGVVAQSWHHPNIPEPLLTLWLDSVMPCAGFTLQGFSGTWHWAMTGRKETPNPPSWGVPAWAGLVLQEPFPPIFLVSWCLQRWGEHPGSVCGSEELRYLGASGLGKIP